MLLTAPKQPLRREPQAMPEPDPGEVTIALSACGVCRTDLHLADGELPQARYPVVPGHEAVGRVIACGSGVESPK
ncbi:MAG: alcohol dehydrogenase, partial [Candidatus Thermofonsia Clade 3 bacterium]